MHLRYSSAPLVLLLLLSLDCSTGDIRLAGSDTSLAGRVEVCYDGVWGTVCGDHWGKGEATVTCKTLGFSSTGKYLMHV